MNKVIMIGRLTRDPEVKVMSNSGRAVTNFTLAVDRKFTKSETKADFFPVNVWDKLGEFCAKYFKKGQQVCICGRMQMREWLDEDKKTHREVELIADDAYFADSKGGEVNG